MSQMNNRKGNRRLRRYNRSVNSVRRRNGGNKRKLMNHITDVLNTMNSATERAFREQNHKGIVSIPRLMFAPEIVIVDLIYPDVTFNRNNATAVFLSWRYRMNSIYDPDPLLGSGAVPGYTFWVGGYDVYTVLELGYDIGLANLESSPVDVVCWPTQTDVGSNYSSTSEAFGNPHATQTQLSAKTGNDRARLKGWIDLGTFYGNIFQYLSGGYSGVAGANPSALMYLNVGAVSASTFTANNGLDIRVTLTFRTAFSKRKIVTA